MRHHEDGTIELLSLGDASAPPPTSPVPAKAPARPPKYEPPPESEVRPPLLDTDDDPLLDGLTETVDLDSLKKPVGQASAKEKAGDKPEPPVEEDEDTQPLPLDE